MPIISDIRACIGKPSLANRIAAAAQSPKLIVPKFSSAVIHASGAAGTTVRSTPRGIAPWKRFSNRSGVTARGHHPRPLIVRTSRVAAR
jgi:hypothetical protein